MVKGVQRIPVTVKIRLGWDDKHRNHVDLARAAVDGGASAVFVHGRTRDARYRSAADWDAVGEVVSADPIEALRDKVTAVDAREAIILTRPHVVAEFFHVDWTSRARRKLGVPVLHLLEHENFDQQAGEGEGITGL